MKIYIDMDDVVADWHAAAEQFLKMRWSKDNERIPQQDWDRIKHDSHFYRNLPLKEDAKTLVEYCTDAVKIGLAEGVYFLTALPHDYSMPYTAQDKVWWANEHFPGVPVFFGPFSHDKYRHCRPGDILIDDRTSNCEEWIAAGGRAHIYRIWPACEYWLEEQILNKRIGIFYELLEPQVKQMYDEAGKK
jgi:5'(3')-deoxyribonucleotidase